MSGTECGCERGEVLRALSACLEAQWSLRSTPESTSLAEAGIKAIQTGLFAPEGVARTEGSRMAAQAVALAGAPVTEALGQEPGTALLTVMALWKHISDHLPACRDSRGRKHVAGALRRVNAALGVGTAAEGMELLAMLLEPQAAPGLDNAVLQAALKAEFPVAIGAAEVMEIAETLAIRRKSAEPAKPYADWQELVETWKERRLRGIETELALVRGEVTAEAERICENAGLQYAREGNALRLPEKDYRRFCRLVAAAVREPYFARRDDEGMQIYRRDTLLDDRIRERKHMEIGIAVLPEGRTVPEQGGGGVPRRLQLPGGEILYPRRYLPGGGEPQGPERERQWGSGPAVRFLRWGWRTARKLWIYAGAPFRTLGWGLSANSRKLYRYRNLHKGERCFLIGNGPSLRAEDLDKLRNEKTIACNLVYQLFDQTNWRPTYHCITDSVYAKNMYLEFADRIEGTFFTNAYARKFMKRTPRDTVYVYNLRREPYRVHGNMLAYYHPARATVMSFMIELAVYMGFTEIFLLGVDCTNSFTTGHFMPNYEPDRVNKAQETVIKKIFHGERKTLAELGEYRLDRTQQAYALLKQYAQRRGVRIYNATRGGALELFERVDFDEVV